MSTSIVTIRNGQNGPDYDALVNDTIVNGVSGKMGIAEVRNAIDATVGTITANAQTIVIPCENHTMVTVAIWGTYSAVNLAFEVSYDDGVTWWTCSAVTMSNNNVVTTTGSLTNTTQHYKAFVGGADMFRVRATAFTSGTQNVVLKALSVGSDPFTTPTLAASVGLNASIAIDASMTSVSPVIVGGRASTAVPTPVSADGDAQAPWVSRTGEAVVLGHERIARVSVTPTISTTVYAAGEQVGGLMTFTGAGLATGRGGRVVGATITDRDKEKAGLQMWLFQVAPTIASTDNNPFDITDGNLELAQFIGHIDFLNANYRDTVNNSACAGTLVAAPDGGFRFSSSGTGGALYGVLVCTGTPTYTGTNDLVVSLFTVQS